MLGKNNYINRIVENTVLQVELSFTERNIQNGEVIDLSTLFEDNL